MNKWIAVAAAVVVLIAGGVAGFAVGRTTGDDHGAAMASETTMSMDHGDMAGMSEGASGTMATDEQRFLELMIAHHQMAVDMATAELAHGTNPKVKAIARRVIAAQDTEIAQMTAWYRDWYGIDPSTNTGTEATTTTTMAEGMDGEAIATAANPDMEFLTGMIAHHASALVMADMARRSDPREQVATLVESITSSQSAEIAEMQALREVMGAP